MSRRVLATIPEPYEDVRSLRTAVMALKEVVETLTGQRGTRNDQAVTFADLPSTPDGVTMPVGGVFKLAEGVTGAASPTTGAIILPTSGYHCLELYVKHGEVSAAGALGMEFSWDGGATWPNAANQYQNLGDQMTSANASGSWSGFYGVYPLAYLTYSIGATAGSSVELSARATIFIPQAADVMTYFVQSLCFDGTNYRQVRSSGLSSLLAAPPNRMRFRCTAGNILPGMIWQLNGVQ